MSLVNTLWDDFAGFWANDVWPGLKSLFKSTVSAEVTALQPIVSATVAEIGAALPSVTSLSQAATVMGGIFTSVAQKAEAASISAGVASLVTAVSGEIGNLLGATTPSVTTTGTINAS